MKFIKSINGYVLPFSTSEYEDNSEPLYDKDSGRESLDGTFVGTKIGDFPKLNVQIPAMPNSLLSQFKKECKKSPVTLEWWSSIENKFIKSDFYPGAIKSQVLFVQGSMVIMKPFVMEFTTIRRDED